MDQPTQCPNCKADVQLNCSFSNLEIDGGTASQDVWCLQCNAQWQEIYTFRAIEMIESGTKLLKSV